MEDPNQEKKSRFDLQPHYIEWGLTALGVIVACVLVVFVLFRMTMIWGIIKKFFSILSPFIYGFVMAYLLMPVFNMLYRNLQPPMSRKFKNGTRLAKGLCSALTLAFGLAVVGVLPAPQNFFPRRFRCCWRCCLWPRCCGWCCRSWSRVSPRW